MIGISEKQNTTINNLTNYDFNLGIDGYKFSDLFDAVKLCEIAEKFYGEVKKENPILHDALTKYIANCGAGYERRVESKILTDSAAYLSEFIARMFEINREREDLQRAIGEQDPIWTYKFFVQRRAIKKFTAESLVDFNEAELTLALEEFKYAAFDQTLICDEELAIAFITQKLTQAEEALQKNLEITTEIRETLNKINTAYDQLKDKTFGKVFPASFSKRKKPAIRCKSKPFYICLKRGRQLSFSKKRKNGTASKLRTDSITKILFI